MNTIYVNGEKFEKSVVTAMSRTDFINTYKTKLDKLAKAKIYDQFTLTADAFKANVKNRMYNPKSETEIMQDTIDSLVIASLGGA